MINCVIIEDEPFAQLGLINLIKLHDDLGVSATFDNIADFIQFTETKQDKPIDLLFLDIELPGTNGINFLREQKPDVPVVLTTAYNHYAIESYELNALDYLLKPISKDRFTQSMAKARNYIEFLVLKNSRTLDFTYIRSDKVVEKIYFKEIILVEAMRNYVIYHCEKRKLVSYNALKNVEQLLPKDQFIKIQKSFIINKYKVEKIHKGSVTIHNKTLSINRMKKNDIIARLIEK
jgi:DNA-binding LytR/AlgR family response regulator